MNFKKKCLVLFLLVSIIACKENEQSAIDPQIIPAPNTLNINKGEFLLSSNTNLVYDEELKPAVAYWESITTPVFGGNTGEVNTIKFVLDKTIKNLEAYNLVVNTEEITIKASSAKGAFYAVQTLIQLLPAEFIEKEYKSNSLKIKALTITDKPQFSYRGMHLDVARHMYPVEFIKKYIDALAMLKMNTFHWHLTEDQGWRIEIKKYPKLQKVAAYRKETLMGHYSDQPHQFDGKKYGGYYTQEEVKEVVAYAAERFVTVIPEIEMPGHSQAAIAAYPELGCTGEQVEVATKWGVFEDIYCTKDETFNFIENVLDEVVALFPSEYIHIGGDEAPKTRWKTCKNCQARIKAEGLKDEHELQNYFITRMEKYLNSKGKQIIGWDEILEGGLAPNATVMSWRGTSGAVEAAKSGHNVVMTPTSHCYFDYYQSDNENEPTAIGGYLPLEKVYSFNPIPDELTEEESKYIIGVQGNVWTEYMPTSEQVEYMAFPRILAMSEVLWTNTENKNYRDFVTRVEDFHKRLYVLGINYANHLYEINGEMISINNESFYKLETLTEGKDIRYTLDGNEPTLKSEIYKAEIPISKSLEIKAAVFNAEEKLGKIFSQNINFHKAVGAKISIDKEPHKAYSGSGAEGLINGISGSVSRYGDKEWLGFWGEDIVVIIDFSTPKEISSISTRFHNGNGQWIYAPEEIGFSFKLQEDGRTINDIKLIKDSHDLIVDYAYKIEPTVVTRIEIVIKNYGTIPEGKQGAGNKAWTFIDEIIIN
ncbi:MAG: family 20 glycosylhydrolase [Winogradskyella sp.]|uniref:beta-N-acetylhexosaminidase n=1 Tax=Winogradskyella sp. TaxID=1883156 RepID=UPI0017970C9B|nr:family 20 glycosylhydrolase [Winogradskyella sp.]MBT8244956.1 family 20 glycosylhydrolase [Winogradskyella sp.]NNK22202.1 family 20 glycosylhydrolase [Winogradskyella sp.]